MAVTLAAGAAVSTVNGEVETSFAPSASGVVTLMVYVPLGTLSAGIVNLLSVTVTVPISTGVPSSSNSSTLEPFGAFSVSPVKPLLPNSALLT